MNDLTSLTDTELNEALSSCRRAIDSEHEVDAVYTRRDLLVAEMERRRVSEPLGQPSGQRLTDCEKCAASGRKCDFDPERGRCSVLS